MWTDPAEACQRTVTPRKMEDKAMNGSRVVGVLSLAGACLFVGAGCAGTTISVSSDPAGATIYHAAGTGHLAYRWREKGMTPLTYYTVNQVEVVKLVWSDGTESEVKRGPVDVWGVKSAAFHFDKSGRAARSSDAFFREKPTEINLLSLTWPLENVAIADLVVLALSAAEVKTLTDKLRSALIRTRFFRIVSRSQMEAILKEQAFQRTDSCDDRECLVEMGRLVSAQKIIGGTVGKVGATFYVSLRMVDVQTGEVEDAVERELKGEPDQLLGLIEEAGKELCMRYAERRRSE